MLPRSCSVRALRVNGAAELLLLLGADFAFLFRLVPEPLLCARMKQNACCMLRNCMREHGGGTPESAAARTLRVSMIRALDAAMTSRARWRR